MPIDGRLREIEAASEKLDLSTELRSPVAGNHKHGFHFGALDRVYKLPPSRCMLRSVSKK